MSLCVDNDGNSVDSHRESNSCMLMDLHFSEKHLSIVEKSTEVSIKTKDEFKLRISEGTDLDILVKLFDDNFLIYMRMEINDIEW